MVDFYNHVKHCTTHPKFLHSNSTSHRWVFGAIAELIDNAIDPDVNASQFCIDMKEFNGEPCLVFMDNGCGLIPERLHKMLSFGHSKKQMNPGDRSIGKHGNGFKSGTMRLGKDVLVLTKCATSMTAGFLSQTFLADTQAEDILIPQVSWDLEGNRLSPMDLEIEESLKAICTYSIFPDEESLLAQLEAIPQTGAILIISNLRRHEGVLELDFETDPHDIRITSEITASHFQQLRPNQPNTTEVPMDFSLRAYVSILYKVPRMQIFIRDKKVKTKRIAGILSQKETETYKPYGVAESIKIELGFNTENKSLYGMMLYHRNRLIKAYMRVGMQLEENERGMGVIGLAEADFLQPTHNKQDFDDTTAYRRLLKKLSEVLAEYWWEKKERIYTPPIQQELRTIRRGPPLVASEDTPDVIWVQCDNPTCLKWRILPPGTDVSLLPDIWYCEYHPDEKYRRHEEPEQEWDASVQHEVMSKHEIVERRKERKREYDREKKEREAERKRQRLEAQTRDTQALLQKQKEEMAKSVQEQQEREQLELQEQKRRQEAMNKLTEEYAAMEAKRDEMLRQQKELEKQLEQTQEELTLKAKEKEDNALLQLQKAPSEREESRDLRENGRLPEPRQDDPAPHSVGNKVGGSSRSTRRPLEREKPGAMQEPNLQDIVPLALSSPQSQHSYPQTNQGSHDHATNGLPPSDTRGGHGLAALTPSTSPRKRAKEAQVSQPSRHGKTLEAVSNSNSGSSQQTQRKGTSLLSTSLWANGVQGAWVDGVRRKFRAVQSSQSVHIDSSPAQDSHRYEGGDRLSTGEDPPLAHPSTPATPLLGCPPSTAPSERQFQNPIQHSLMSQIPAPNEQILEVCTSSLEQRSAGESGAAHQELLVSSAGANGSCLEGLDQGQVLHHYGHVEDTGSDQLENSGGHQDFSARFDEPQGNLSFGSGMLSVHLPMDLMVTSNCRSEAELTLDKAVFSLQRRLRLALNTLVRIGGCADSNLFELDVLPSTDSEVVNLCEKAKLHVETKVQNYRQEVANLKAELAYLMADKLQHGQSWNFKIQSIASKWGIGVEVSKRS